MLSFACPLCALQDGWVYTRGLNGAPFHLQYLTSLEWALPLGHALGRWTVLDEVHRRTARSRIHPSAMQNNMALQTGPERALAIAASFLALGVSSLFISCSVLQACSKLKFAHEGARSYMLRMTLM